MKTLYKIRYIFIIVLFAAVYSCNKYTATNDDEYITIGTYNIEWLGDGYKDRIKRTPDDYIRIAEVIKNSGADILGVEEIENEKALDMLLSYLPGWKYYLSDGAGSQNVGFIFKDDITVKKIGDYQPISIYKGRTRPGFVIQAKKGNFDWIMMVVHFKATSRYDNTPEKRANSIEMRMRQSVLATRWIDSVLAASSEKDVIIVGDFNDWTGRDENATLTKLLNDNNVEFLTGSLRSCKYSKWYVIDHIIISDNLKNRFLKGSQRVYDSYSSYPKEVAAKISDHCPVLAEFNYQLPDDD